MATSKPMEAMVSQLFVTRMGSFPASFRIPEVTSRGIIKLYETFEARVEYLGVRKILINHRILGCLILGPLGIRNQTEDFQNLTAGSHQMEDKRNLYLIMEMCSGGLSKDDIFKRCFVLVWA